MRTVQRNFRNHWGDQDPWRDENHNVIPNFIEDLAKKTDHYKALSQKYDNEDSIFYYLNQKHKVKLLITTARRRKKCPHSIRYATW